MTVTAPRETTTSSRALDPNRLDEFMSGFVKDFGAILQAPTVVLGYRLGLYSALDQYGPCTSTRLAEQTGTSERYLREWLRAQAAGGYATYDATNDSYSLSPEQSFALAQPDSPAFIPGAFLIAAGIFKVEKQLAEAFRSGNGFAWSEHDTDMFDGVERFFRPGYLANLTTTWLPALDGVVARLESGGMVADVGCGHGASSVLMAQAFPRARVFGFDSHAPSIDTAADRARQAGVTNAEFQVAAAADYPGEGYDLVTFFDCLHDMGDPVGAAGHVRETLASDGVLMIVEPIAGDSVLANLNPIGRMYYSSSTMICVPNAIAQGGDALGNQAGEAATAKVITEAGFSGFRRVAETAFNAIYEARK